jgi:hypothetical protein
LAGLLLCFLFDFFVKLQNSLIFQFHFHSAEVNNNAEKILTFDESQEFSSVDTLLQTENGTNRKRQLLFASCKEKMETAKFRLFAANEMEMKRLFSSVGNR